MEFFLGCVAIVIIIVVISIKVSKANSEKFRADFERFAFENKLQYFPYGNGPPIPPGCSNLWGSHPGLLVNNSELLNSFMGFSPFGIGSSPQVQHLLLGKDDVGEWINFQYSYVVSSGKSSTTYTYGIYALRLPCRFPNLSVRRANFMDRAANSLGIRDVQFESESFNKEFAVSAEDQRFAFDILHAEAMDFLESSIIEHVQCGRSLIFLHSDDAYSLGAVVRNRDALKSFASLIPEYVMRDRSYITREPESR